MSHFAVYECNVSNLEYIKKSLEDMGLSYKLDTIITDYYGQKRKAVLGVVKEGRLLPLGWVQGKESLELQADWFKVPYSQREFTNRIAQHHAKYQVMDVCAENRWDVDPDSIQFNDEGELELLATSYM